VVVPSLWHAPWEVPQNSAVSAAGLQRVELVAFELAMPAAPGHYDHLGAWGDDGGAMAGQRQPWTPRGPLLAATDPAL